MRLAIVAGLLMAVSMPAAAIAADARAEDSATPDKPAKAKKICRTDEAQTVSRMPRRICKTAAEWETPGNNVGRGDLQRMGAN
jgi:hypothetical protein